MMNDELMHYGVMNMKWGHKKASSSKSSISAKQHVAISGKKLAKKGSSTPQPYTRPKSMPPKRLTDAQLKSRINRIEMENKYATLTKKKTSPAKKMIMDILANAIKTNATAYVTKMMGKGIENFTAQKPNPTPKPHKPTPNSNQSSKPRTKRRLIRIRG